MTRAAFNLVLQDKDGKLMEGAQVEIRREAPGQPKVQVYADPAGNQPLGNPFTLVAGVGVVYVEEGFYRIDAKRNGEQAIEPMRNVGISRLQGLPSSLSMPMGAWADDHPYALNDRVTHSNGEGTVYHFISRTDDNLDNEPDVTTPGDTDEWMFAGVAIEGPAGPNAISLLTDVDLDAPQDGDALLYEDGDWKNKPVAKSPDVQRIEVLTPGEYDALDPPDDNTLYIQVPDED